MGVEERVRKQTEQRKVGLGLAGVHDTWGKVFHAKPLGSQRKWKSRMKAEPCFRRWLWQCLKWDRARKVLKSEEELFQSLERSNKGLCNNRRAMKMERIQEQLQRALLRLGVRF